MILSQAQLGLTTINNMDETKIQELERRIKDLEEVRHLGFVKQMREEIVGQPSADADSAVTLVLPISVDIMTGLGSINILDFPDGFIEVIRPNGERVLVPTYNKSRF